MMTTSAGRYCRPGVGALSDSDIPNRRWPVASQLKVMRQSRRCPARRGFRCFPVTTTSSTSRPTTCRTPPVPGRCDPAPSNRPLKRPLPTTRNKMKSEGTEMKSLSSEDVRNQAFSATKRGYAEGEVDDLLDEIAIALDERDAAIERLNEGLAQKEESRNASVADGIDATAHAAREERAEAVTTLLAIAQRT